MRAILIELRQKDINASGALERPAAEVHRAKKSSRHEDVALPIDGDCEAFVKVGIAKALTKDVLEALAPKRLDVDEKRQQKNHSKQVSIASFPHRRPHFPIGTCHLLDLLGVGYKTGFGKLVLASHRVLALEEGICLENF